MISLTYISTATKPIPPAELTALLGWVRELNHRVGLTGVLLHADGHFIQTLEGEEETVETVFERIRVDPRHRSVDVALRERIEARVFPDWSMGYRTLDPAALAAMGYNDFLGTRGRSEEAARLGNAGIFLRAFRDTMRAGYDGAALGRPSLNGS